MKSIFTLKNLFCIVLAMILFIIISPIFKFIGAICGAVVCYWLAKLAYDFIIYKRNQRVTTYF